MIIQNIISHNLRNHLLAFENIAKFYIKIKYDMFCVKIIAYAQAMHMCSL